MLIRDADPAHDAAACAAIYAPFVRDTAISLEEQPPDADEFAERIEGISRTHPWLVAEEAGQVVGYAYGCPHREDPAYRWTAEVSVYVEGAHQRRGVGRALYVELLRLLTRRGVHVACAGMTLPNEASVAFHESFGFTPAAVYRRIGFKLGAWRDVGWWQLELAGSGSEPPAEPEGLARLA